MNRQPRLKFKAPKRPPRRKRRPQQLSLFTQIARARVRRMGCVNCADYEREGRPAVVGMPECPYCGATWTVPTAEQEAEFDREMRGGR